AVENQLLIALVTYCLLMLLKLDTGHKGPLLEIKRLLHTCLYLSYQFFVKKLKRQPTRSSLGRRSTDYEAIFQETYRQVMAGEADHLDDLTYDPVIL
ncbi:MAG: IS4 family transposase, partial [Bacillota bacterium]|nr:IS4 family transposase [Bacillota bacterium]